ncbi:hypothetical protein B0H12DRAFT_1077413 [Mycena haematopus]|nr:hypothetical protein B0H12DRAFT_1077413 [Mycena haematopus]
MEVEMEIKEPLCERCSRERWSHRKRGVWCYVRSLRRGGGAVLLGMASDNEGIACTSRDWRRRRLTLLSSGSAWSLWEVVLGNHKQLLSRRGHEDIAWYQLEAISALRCCEQPINDLASCSALALQQALTKPRSWAEHVRRADQLVGGAAPAGRRRSFVTFEEIEGALLVESAVSSVDVVVAGVDIHVGESASTGSS